MRARIPELGEYVQMGKYATAFRGVKGQVVKIDRSPPQGVLKATGGDNHVELYILTALSYGGKRVMVKASPYELEGALLDQRPIMGRR